MPPRSIPSVSGVVPSIQSWIQSSGCVGREVLEVLADRPIGHAEQAREVAGAGEVGAVARRALRRDLFDERLAHRRVGRRAAARR